jgi:hypothetical protein
MFSRLVRPLGILGSLVGLITMMFAVSNMALAAGHTGHGGPLIALASPTSVGVTGTPVETVNPGTMAVTGTFTSGSSSVTLNGSDHLAAVIGTLLVNPADNTGAGAGWSVSASAAALSDGATPTPHTLTTRLTTTGAGAVALACSGGSTCVTTGMTVNSTAVLNGSSAALAAAPSGDGMGSYTFTDALEVDIPANAFAGTYTSAVTLTMTSAS